MLGTLTCALEREEREREEQRAREKQGRTRKHKRPPPFEVFFVCESDPNKGLLTEEEACDELKEAYRRGVADFHRDGEPTLGVAHEWADWPLPIGRNRNIGLKWHDLGTQSKPSVGRSLPAEANAALVDAISKRPASSLKWVCRGPSRPSGDVLTNAALATALATKLEFTQDEVDAFGIQFEVYTNQFILSSGLYYQPFEVLFDSHEELPQPSVVNFRPNDFIYVEACGSYFVAAGDDDDTLVSHLQRKIVQKMQSASKGEHGAMWFDMPAYQQASLIRILERVVEESDLHIPGSALNSKLELPGGQGGFHVYCSPNNAGAIDFVYGELRHGFQGQLRIACSAKIVAEQEEADGMVRHHEKNGRRLRMNATVVDVDAAVEATLAVLPTSGASSFFHAAAAALPGCRQMLGKLLAIFRIRGSPAQMKALADSKGPAPPCIFVLYLDHCTWSSSQSKVLKDEVMAQLRTVHNGRTPSTLLLLHEQNGSSDQLTSLEQIFDSTPRELLKAGLFNARLVTLHAGAQRSLSLLEAAQHLQALLSAPVYANPRPRSRWIVPNVSIQQRNEVQRMLSITDLCCSFMIEGLDDDASSMELSPCLTKATGNLTTLSQAETAGTSQATVFSPADVGRILTVTNRKRVFVDGCERIVRYDYEWDPFSKRGWQALPGKQKSPTSKLELAFPSTKDLHKVPTLAIKDARIEFVSPGANSLVWIRLEDQTRHCFSNAVRGRGLLHRLVPKGEFAATSTPRKVHIDRVGEMLKRVDGIVVLQSQETCGSKADTAARELSLPPDRYPPAAAVREVRNARCLWRAQRHEKQEAATLSEEELAMVDKDEDASAIQVSGANSNATLTAVSALPAGISVGPAHNPRSGRSKLLMTRPPLALPPKGRIADDSPPSSRGMERHATTDTPPRAFTTMRTAPEVSSPPPSPPNELTPMENTTVSESLTIAARARNEAYESPDVQRYFTVAQCGERDMIHLKELDAQHLMATLQQRFKEHIVYTNIGDIIISVNPFRKTANSKDEVQRRYADKFKAVFAAGEAAVAEQLAQLPPHIFTLIGQIYARLRKLAESSEGHSISILIAGESGAGKTEAMKLCVSHLGMLSSEQQGAVKRCVPLL